jgi:hypothetical protein
MRRQPCADGTGEMGLMWVCLQLEMALASLQGEPLKAEDKARLFVRGGVDVTDAATLTPELFAGAVQVVTALGPVFGKLPEGGFGFFDGMTSEKVDAEGVANVAAAAKALLPPSTRQQKLVKPSHSHTLSRRCFLFVADGMELRI